jgi:hypothetical protein
MPFLGGSLPLLQRPPPNRSMLSRETLHEVMCETAALIGLGRITACEDSDGWSMDLDERGTFDIEHDTDDDRVVISIAIGSVAETARASIYELLLAYNHLRTDTGGTRMALDLPGQQVVMMREIPSLALSPQRLCSVIENMALVHGAWREVLRLGEVRGG